MSPRGFTLIEAVIYLGLFSILIGGAVVCAFELFETAAIGSTYVMLIDESDFILGKIAWVLGDASSISEPVLGAADDTLIIIPYDAARGTPIAFSRGMADLTVAFGSDDPLPLNNTNITVERISFTHVDDPEGIETVLTLSAHAPNGTLLVRTATSTVYVK